MDIAAPTAASVQPAHRNAYPGDMKRDEHDYLLLSKLLDEGLDRPREERRSWLEQLPPVHAALADAVGPARAHVVAASLTPDAVTPAWAVSVSVQAAVAELVGKTCAAVGAVMVIVGATLSGTATVKERVAELALPALSTALTVSV